MRSGRGGYRENCGRPNTWPSECPHKNTKLIRVPIAVADRLMQIARALDAGMEVVVQPKQLELPVSGRK